MERGDHGVAGAVTTRDHDGAAPGRMEEAVELPGVAGLGHLDGRVAVEHLQRVAEGVGAAGVGVRDQQEWFHVLHTRSPGRRDGPIGPTRRIW